MQALDPRALNNPCVVNDVQAKLFDCASPMVSTTVERVLCCLRHECQFQLVKSVVSDNEYY